MGVQRIGTVINDKPMKINEVFLKKNVNDNNDRLANTKTHHTEYIANKLVKIYNAPMSRNFFLKCAWHLSEDTIWSAVESSRRKAIKSPIRYFVAICNKALQERPINR